MVAFVVAIVSLFLAGTAKDAAAYPWMIRHDYANCSTCHLDPSGAGVLTPYGRAQSEVLLRTRYGTPAEDEDPSKLAAFAFGAIPLPEEVSLQADVRVMHLRTKPPSPAPLVARTILMQADGAVGLSIDRFRGAGTLGYVHEGALGASVTHGTEDRVVSRQHWAGVVFGKDDAFTLRAGRMNLPFGLRILEHTSWVRQSTRTDVNAAQSHGLALAYGTEKIRAEAMAVLGNFQLSPARLRERGVSGYAELALRQDLAAGVSTLVTHSDYDPETRAPTFRQAHGLFARYTPVKSVVVMAEADLLARSAMRQPILVGTTALLQVDFEPIQGVHAMATGEILQSAFTRGGPSLGGWLSFAWFFAPHADLRADVLLRSMESGGTRVEIPTFLGQIHAFL
ncbi:MAG: hypothetical protein U0169_17345 [Polyangiaceae bacterium]